MTNSITINAGNELIFGSTQVGWVRSINKSGRVMHGALASRVCDYPQTAFYPLERDQEGRRVRGKKIILDMPCYISKSPSDHVPNPALIEAIKI